jgi:hypothetical protein
MGMQGSEVANLHVRYNCSLITRLSPLEWILWQSQNTSTYSKISFFNPKIIRAFFALWDNSNCSMDVQTIHPILSNIFRYQIAIFSAG